MNIGTETDMLIILIIASVFHCVLSQNGPVVDTEYGPVAGITIELHNGIEVNSFYGIPFAEPPVGDLRFEVSQLHVDFSGHILKK